MVEIKKVYTIRNLDELGRALHEAAVNGDKKKLKAILKSDINCDFRNDAGQTPLLCACFKGYDAVVSTLLKQGADPNARSYEGCTAVHAAGCSCNIKIMKMLLAAGGDLRLHDDRGKGIKDYVMSQTDAKKRSHMMEFLEQTRNEAKMDLYFGLDKQPVSPSTITKKKGISTSSLFRTRHTSEAQSLSIFSNGFGKVFVGCEGRVGALAVVPLVKESSLTHDSGGYSFRNGSFMMMESMLWIKVPVSVKRLHRVCDDSGAVDLLIREHKYMAQLRHPNILLLMALCPINSLESLILLYERVDGGSLYTHLYDKMETFDLVTICRIMKQVADALVYLHQESLLHCNISSHAIYLILQSHAKLGNFEYMVESSPVDGLFPKSDIMKEKHIRSALNWMAPEMLGGQRPTKSTDIYSLCAVLWELLHGTVPWCGMKAVDIEKELVKHGSMLDVKKPLKKPLPELLRRGLAVDPSNRSLTLQTFIMKLSDDSVETQIAKRQWYVPREPQRSQMKINATTSFETEDSFSFAEEQSPEIKHISSSSRTCLALPRKSSKCLSDTLMMQLNGIADDEDIKREPALSPAVKSTVPKSRFGIDVVDHARSKPVDDPHAQDGPRQQTSQADLKLAIQRARSAFFGLTSPDKANLRKDTATKLTGLGGTRGSGDALHVNEDEHSNSGHLKDTYKLESSVTSLKQDRDDLRSEKAQAVCSGITSKQSQRSGIYSEQTRSKVTSSWNMHSVSGLKSPTQLATSSCAVRGCHSPVISKQSTTVLNKSLPVIEPKSTSNGDASSGHWAGPVYLSPRRSTSCFSPCSMSSQIVTSSQRCPSLTANTMKSFHSWSTSIDENPFQRSYKPASHHSNSAVFPERIQAAISVYEKNASEPRGTSTSSFTSRTLQVHTENQRFKNPRSDTEKKATPERLSPRLMKEKWFEGNGGINKLISSFQSIAEEHIKKQNVLVMKSRAREEQYKMAAAVKGTKREGKLISGDESHKQANGQQREIVEVIRVKKEDVRDGQPAEDVTNDIYPSPPSSLTNGSYSTDLCGCSTQADKDETPNEAGEEPSKDEEASEAANGSIKKI